MKIQQSKSVTVYVHGVEVTCHNVTFYPHVEATDIEPAEYPFADWNSITIAGVPVDSLFFGKLGDDLMDAVVQYFER